MSALGGSAASQAMSILEILNLVIDNLRVHTHFHDQTRYNEEINTLHAVCLVNRAWYKQALPALYSSINQYELCNACSRSLSRTLASTSCLAELVRYLRLDVSRDGCPSLLNSIFHLQDLSLDLADTWDDYHALLLDMIIFANNSAACLRRLTVRFGTLRRVADGYEGTLNALVRELDALTELHVIDPYTQLLESLLLSLPRPAMLSILEVEDTVTDRRPWLTIDPDIWSGTLPRFTLLHQLRLQGRISYQILDAIPGSLKRLACVDCDAAFAYQLLLRLGKSDWLPLMSQKPSFSVQSVSDNCFRNQGLNVPSMDRVNSIAENAVVAMHGREWGTLDESELFEVRVAQSEICDIVALYSNVLDEDAEQENEEQENEETISEAGESV